MIWLLTIVICAILYRAGGMSKDVDARPKWIPMFMRTSWVRDWLIPIVIYAWLLPYLWPLGILGWLTLLVTIALTGGALTTYWDWLFKEDNFYMHGFMVGLAVLPLAWFGLHWYAIVIRAIVMAIAMGLYCMWEGTDWKEEMFRGTMIAISMPLLLL